jgi:hypothetical protein
MRGGILINVKWSDQKSNRPCDAVGRFAAGLALPALGQTTAESLAVAHGLSSHLTSLVLVDEASEPTIALPLTRKVPLSSSPAAHVFARETTRPNLFARATGTDRVSRLFEEIPEFWDSSPAQIPSIAWAPTQHIDWNTLADALARLDRDAWPKELVDYVRRLSKRKEIKALARLTRLDPEAVVVLLLGLRDAKASRGAARVARHLSRGLSKEAIAAAEVQAQQTDPWREWNANP